MANLNLKDPTPWVIVDGKFIVNLERVVVRFVNVSSMNKLGKSYKPYIFLDGKRVILPFTLNIDHEDPGCPEDANANTA